MLVKGDFWGSFGFGLVFDRTESRVTPTGGQVVMPDLSA